MRRLKLFLKYLLVLVVVLSLVSWLFVQNLKPTYDGELSFDGMTDTVEVYYDTYGIPHIYASNTPDAFRALGYAHAQDRLWQMELLRRIAKGQISEVFGESQLETDTFFLSLGIDEASKETVAALDKNTEAYTLAEAYLEGVNHFVETGPKPVEFYLTGIEKRPFDMVDIHDIIGYMAFTFAQAHKTDPILTRLQHKLGNTYLEDLAIDSDTSTVYIQNFPAQQADSTLALLNAKVAAALSKLPIPQLEGSNSWVLSPEKTKSGKVILANDPHIRLAQPAVWFEAHVSTPDYEMYGYHLGGVPFPLLGHNRYRANGLTMFQNDDLDFYWEERNPENPKEYKTEKGWEPFQTRTKTIRVKDADPVTVTYEATRHGTLLNGIAGQFPFDVPVAVDWIFTKEKNELLEALYGMASANNLQSFQQAVARIHAPGLNVMYGDAEGNVAWFAAGKLYDLPENVHSKFILDGASGANEKTQFFDFSYNPKAINPDWNYVYSANNQPDSLKGRLIPGYYLPENRAKRITQLLDVKDDFDMESSLEMMLDVTSAVVPDMIDTLVRVLSENDLEEREAKALEMLKSWDGNYGLNETAPTIYHRWEYLMAKYTLEDEMSEELFNQFLKTHLFKRTLAPLVAKGDSPWWDDQTTEVKETRTEIFQKALSEALNGLEAQFGLELASWTWNKVHTIEHSHPIGSVETFRSFLNVGPFPVHGGREVINNLAFVYDDHDDQFQVFSGPSTRRVIDFSDIENSMSILPTGQSGNPWSPHYNDQAEMYVNGEFRKMLLNREEIVSTSKNKLVINPN